MIPDRRTIDIYNAYSSGSIFTRFLVSARPLICPLQPIMEKIPPNQTVLDVGCGVGTLLISLAIRGGVGYSIGCDVNSKAIAVAEAAANRLPAEKPEFIVSENKNLIPVGPFDVVTLIDVMHHINPKMQRKFFEICAERVRPGGILIYKDMACAPLWKNLFNRFHDAVMSFQHIHYVPIDEITNWGQQIFLARENQEFYSRFAYGHELVVFRKRGSE